MCCRRALGSFLKQKNRVCRTGRASLSTAHSSGWKKCVFNPYENTLCFWFHLFHSIEIHVCHRWVVEIGNWEMIFTKSYPRQLILNFLLKTHTQPPTICAVICRLKAQHNWVGPQALKNYCVIWLPFHFHCLISHKKRCFSAEQINTNSRCAVTD